MELFPASDVDAWNLIMRVIDECDYYMVIIGGRYGSISDDGVSFTEKEYDYAVSKNKPVIAYLHKDLSLLPSGKVELDSSLRERLQRFREKAEKKHCQYWESADQLRALIYDGILELKRIRPEGGWVRSTQIDETATTRMAELNARIADLEKQLNRKRDEAVIEVDGYAQGPDAIVIKLTNSAGEGHTNKTFSWDKLFGIIAPYLFEPCEEHWIHQTFSSLICADEGVMTGTYFILPADFQTIKVQFLALDYIERKKIDGNRSGWTLSERGKNYLLKMRAVKRDKQI